MLATLRTAAQVYATVFTRPTLIVRFAGLPLVVYAAVLVVAGLTLSAGPSDSATPSGPEVRPFSIVVYLATQLPLLGLSLWVLGLSSYRWHRFILLSDGNARFAAFRLGAGGREYLWNLTVVLCLGSVVALLATSVFNGLILEATTRTGPWEPFAILLNYRLVGLLVLGFALARIGLILPAAAIGRPIGQLEAWDRSKPWGLWHFALIVLVNLPLQALGFCKWFALFWLAPAIEDAVEATIGPAVDGLQSILFFSLGALFSMVILCLTSAVTAVALSYNYLGTSESPAPPQGT